MPVLDWFFQPKLDTNADLLIPYLPLLSGPEIVSGTVKDAGRNWDTPYQEVVVLFAEAMQDPALSVGGTATGFTAYVNGSSHTPTYRSGSGTSQWTLRIPALVVNGDTVEIVYSRTTGATVAVVGGTELTTSGRIPLYNQLTKRIRFLLKDKNNAVVASAAVQVSVHEYSTGIPSGPVWMEQTDKASLTTDGLGLVDAPYSGVLPVGELAYVVVYRPSTTESMGWPDTIT